MATDHTQFRCTRVRKPSCPCSCHGGQTVWGCQQTGSVTCAGRALARDHELDRDYLKHQAQLELAEQAQREHQISIRTPQGRTEWVVRPW